MPWATLGKVWIALLVVGVLVGVVGAIAIAFGRGSARALTSGSSAPPSPALPSSLGAAFTGQ